MPSRYSIRKSPLHKGKYQVRFRCWTGSYKVKKTDLTKSQAKRTKKGYEKIDRKRKRR